MSKSKKPSRKARSVSECRATFSSSEAAKWVAAARKVHKGAVVTRRRETFSFGVLYVVLVVK